MIVPVGVEFRGTRRVRTIFTGPLASGAFTSTAMYTLTADDGGTNPIHTVAVFAIGSNGNAAEFAIDSDLTSGALYTVSYAAVPGADSSTFTGTYDSRVGLELTNAPNVEPETQDSDLLLFNRDLVFNGDFVEDATGDLATLTGRPNWLGAMGRRFGSYGIGWDPLYGANADEEVEAPSPLAPAFAGTLLAQARLDDRTLQATVTLQPAVNDPAGFLYSMSLVPRDGQSPQTILIPTQ